MTKSQNQNGRLENLVSNSTLGVTKRIETRFDSVRRPNVGLEDQSADQAQQTLLANLGRGKMGSNRIHVRTASGWRPFLSMSLDGSKWEGS